LIIVNGSFGYNYVSTAKMTKHYSTMTIGL